MFRYKNQSIQYTHETYNISITIKGMDYAIMSGGDVGPLGEDAVNQLHGLFKWAASSTKG